MYSIQHPLNVNEKTVCTRKIHVLVELLDKTDKFRVLTGRHTGEQGQFIIFYNSFTVLSNAEQRIPRIIEKRL